MFYLGLLVLGLNILLLGVALSNVAAFPRLRTRCAGGPARASVLIPARDEEANLGDCIEGVLGQSVVSEILVYDDHSSDATPYVLDVYTAKHPLVRPATPTPLPAGWCGKNFACWRLAHAAESEWLLFVDADARLAPEAIGAMVLEAEKRGATMLSCWPGLSFESFWERVLMPMLNFCVFTVFPGPLSFQVQSASLGLAHGACILVNRKTYFDVGGHEAVRDEIFEDTLLARHWRRSGERAICLDGQDAVRVRMYSSLKKIWRGFEKNVYLSFRHELSFWLFLLLHGLALFAPFLLAPFAFIWPDTLWPWAAAAAAVLAMRLALALRFQHPLWSCFLHPMAEAMLLALALHARRGARRGVQWKGRRYNASAGE